MFRNQLAELLFSPPDFDLDNALVIVDLAGKHFSVVDQRNNQEDEYEVHGALNCEGLHVNDSFIGLKQVVYCKAERQQNDQNSVAFELKRLRQEGQHHVHSKGDFDGLAID